MSYRGIETVIEQLDAETGHVISFLFNAGERPEHALSVPIDYISLVPLLEAVGAQLKARYEQAFDSSGEIVHADSILDMNGLFVFLHRYIETARRAGHPIKAEAVTDLRRVFNELKPLVEEAVEM